MLYIDYVQDVFLNYERKKAAKNLSSRLTHPTTANLRDECIALCNERFTIRDQGILKTFFGPIGGDAAICIQKIQKHDVDRFRPLVKFLKNGSKDPHVKNVDLVAWLIDYKNRPFGGVVNQRPEAGKDEPESDTQTEPPTKPTDSFGNLETESPVGQPKGKETKKWWEKIFERKAGITILILLVTNVGAYMLWTSMKSPTDITGKEKCMYWADDHYQPVSCNQKVENSLVIALDSQRLNQFKKITTPDTITVESIGKLWYVRINGDMEYYTADGFHPVDIQLKLKPITQYIINKYIHPANGVK